MAEFSAGLFDEGEGVAAWSIYIQTRCQHDEVTAEVLENCKNTIKNAVCGTNFTIDDTRFTEETDTDATLEVVLVGNAEFGSIDEIADSLHEKVAGELAETPLEVVHVLSHECGNVPVFTGGISDSGSTDDSLSMTDFSDLGSDDTKSVFSTHGYGVLPRCIIGDELMTIIIDAMMDTVAAVRSANHKDRVKYSEVMQRDEGRFDVSLEGSALSTPALKSFVYYATPGSDNGVGAGGAPWLKTVDACLGAGCYELSRSGVVLSTGGCATGAQYWHADGQEQLPPCQALCLFIPLCDLTDRTGFTSFWPGSQLYKQSALLACDLPAKMPRCAMVEGKVNFGDCLLYDYKLIHRGEANNMAKGETRPIMYVIYAIHGYSEPNFHASSIYDALEKYKSTCVQ